MAEAAAPHRWRFHRIGGLDQAVLETGEDLAQLTALDQKLWVALSCPVRGLELDERTLELLDLDRDGRVRAPEILAAVALCAARLRDLGQLVPGRPALPLAAISEATPEGRATLGAARRILASLGKADAAEIAPADVRDLSRVWVGTSFNGDGVVPPEAAEDPAPRRAIEEAMACAGSVPDRSGHPGIDRERVERFFAELAAFDGWSRAGEAAPLNPFGAATPAIFGAVEAVRAKVEEHFTRSALAAIGVGPAAGAERLPGAPLPAGPAAAAADLPLARIEPGAELELTGPVNPAWRARLAALAALPRDAIAGAWDPTSGRLAAADWERLLAALAPRAAWAASPAGAGVARLGPARVRELLAGEARPAIEALLARDLAVAAEAAAIDDVARLVHYQRDLHTLLRNFVSFADFYDPARFGIFQAGTLFIDARSTRLCIRVDDPAAHALLAARANLHIAYCECRRAGEAPLRIAACITQGDGDSITVGRNGIFYDRRGRDWDATVLRVLENPISVRQAFFSPYVKFARMVEAQVEKFAAAKAKSTDSRLEAAATGVTGRAAGSGPAAAPVDVGRMVGIVAALGVGAGALGSLAAAFVSGFLGLQPWWARLAAIAGIVLAISGPSVLLAWLKIRARTLGPVLDATGWAVNGRVRVNLPLGAVLTARASLPPGSWRSLEDPYLDRAARRRRRIAWAAALAIGAALAWARHAGLWPFGTRPW